MEATKRFREAHANKVQASVNCDTLQESLRLAELEYSKFDEEMAVAQSALIDWTLDGSDKNE